MTAAEQQAGFRPIPRQLGSAWVYGLLMLSVVINVFLAKEISGLRKEAEAKDGRLHVGTSVPTIEASSAEGAGQILRYGEVRVPTVLYVFTPQCGWCRKNLDNLRVLINGAGSQYRIVGISLNTQDLKEYLDKEHLRFPVYTGISDSLRSAYHLGGTPETIIVSPEGKVLKVWIGAYQDRVKEEIERYLSIRLPGCCDTVAENKSPRP